MGYMIIFKVSTHKNNILKVVKILRSTDHHPSFNYGGHQFREVSIY